MGAEIEPADTDSVTLARRAALALRLRAARTWVVQRITKGPVVNAVLAAATTFAILSDFTTHIWVSHPMLAGLISGAVILGWTVQGVNRYLASRAQKRWYITAGVALEDLGRVARATWTVLGPMKLQLIGPSVLQPATEFREDMLSPARRAELLKAASNLAANAQGRKRIFNELHGVTDGTRQVLALWTPIMVTQPDSSELLARFAQLLRREVGLLALMSGEITIGDTVPGLPPEEIGQRLTAIITDAAEQDRDLFVMAQRVAPSVDALANLGAETDV